MSAAIRSRAAALVLVALFAVSASGTAATKRSSRTTSSDSVLVRVGTSVITRGDVQRRLDEIPEAARANFQTPEGRQQLLDRMVEEKVWLQIATKEGVADRPKVKQQLEQQRRDLLIRTYLGEVMQNNPAPSDSEARLYYEEHKADYRTPATVTVRHILTKTEADAKKVLAQAKAKPGEWDKLVAKWSTDSTTRATGGSLGTVTKEGQFAMLGPQPALAESAFALGAGRVGGPWKSERGWHVIKVEDVKPEGSRSFETARPMIRRQLSQERSQEFYRRKLEDARKRLGVRPDSAAIRKFVSQKKTAREMFKEAQELGPAQDRIAAYRRLLQEYPNSDVSPQAQFMIGFIHSEELKNYDEADKAFREVLARYPKSELAASAKWMVEHMRTEDAPAFIPMEADSSRPADAPPRANKSSSGKP